MPSPPKAINLAQKVNGETIVARNKVLGLPSNTAAGHKGFAELLRQLQEAHELELGACLTEINRLTSIVAASTVGGSEKLISEVVEESAEEPRKEEQTPASNVVDEEVGGEEKNQGDDVEDSTTVQGRRRSGSLPFILQERQRSSHFGIAFLEDVVTSNTFEMAFACLIILNAMVVALEIQYMGMDIGLAVDYRWTQMSAEVAWPWAPMLFKIAGYFFGVMFLLELIIKVVAFRCQFIRDYWNWIDAFIVGMWFVEVFGILIFVSPSLLRLFRLARLLRLIRIVRMVQAFDALYIMTTALKSSASVLLWACTLLFLIQTTLALTLTQVLHEKYFNDNSRDQAEMQKMFEYFGTFTRSLMSMFEITLGNWPPVCRLLSENFNEWFMLLCVMHKLTIGFAVVGVINGVFMQETFKVASLDDKIMMRHKEMASKAHKKKMRLLFREMDSNGNGLLSFEEFSSVLNLPPVKLWLGAMEMDHHGDLEALFSLLDDGDGVLSADELVTGVGRLKGAARSIDLALLSREVERLASLLDVKPSTRRPSLLKCYKV